MSLALSALLTAAIVPTGGAYDVTGTAGSYASTWKHRFVMPPIVVTGLTGASQWRVQIDDGAHTWPVSPVIDSTGTTSALNLGVLDIPGIAQGSILDLRARLENTPASPTSIGTCTISTGAPMLVTKSAHGLNEGDVVKFTTTGALPGPLVVGTAYYVRYIGTGTLNLAATEGGASINFTSGAGSGTHTLTLYKAVSAWQTPITFTTGAALLAVPVISTQQIVGVQVYPAGTSAISLGWNNYPAEVQADILGTYIVISAQSATGSGSSFLQVDGLNNFAQLTLVDFSDGEEINFVLYPAIEYPLDAFGVFTATAGADKTTAYPITSLRATATGIVGTPDDSTPLAGAATLQLQLGVIAAGTIQYLGSGAVASDGWSLADAPAGLSISAPSPAHRLGVLGGAPTQEGIFPALVACVSRLGYVPSVAKLECTIAVSGGLCLGWLHTNPRALDLQFMLRSRVVESYRFAEAIELTRGDTETAYIILRSGPASATNRGPVVDPSAYKSANLIIRRENNLDAEPYLDLTAPLAIANQTTFTVAPSTELITCADAHQQLVGELVQFSSDSALPTPLVAGVDYYVMAAGLTALTLKVSETRTGAAVNLTDTGTGTHTLRVWRVATQTIAGHVVIPLTIPVESVILDEQFALINAAPDADPAELALNGLGELVLLDPTGLELSSRHFAVLLLQDVAR